MGEWDDEFMVMATRAREWELARAVAEEDDNEWEEETDYEWRELNTVERTGDVRETESASESASRTGDTDIVYIASEASFAESEEDAAEGERILSERQDSSDAIDAAPTVPISISTLTPTLNQRDDSTYNSVDNRTQTEDFRSRSDRAGETDWQASLEVRIGEEQNNRAEIVTTVRAFYAMKLRQLRRGLVLHYADQVDAPRAMRQENESLKRDIDILCEELNELRIRIRDDERSGEVERLRLMYSPGPSVGRQSDSSGS